MPSSQFLTVNGLKLHYLDFGNSEKPALVCIHGLSGNAHNFDALAPQLRDAYHVIAVDVRGRGDSAWGPSGDYNTAVYVNDLAAMLEALAIDRVTLIGTSMGGMISMGYAGGFPDRVTKLVLNDVGPEIDQTGAKRITSYMTSSPTDFADLNEVVAYYRENYPPMRTLPEATLAEFVGWSVKPAASGRLTWKLDPAVRNVPRTGSAARPVDMWVPFARIIAPILVVRGAESDILSRATADRMGRALRNLRTVEVPGVGHAPSLAEPEALAAIKDFLGC
jgi:esterase